MSNVYDNWKIVTETDFVTLFIKTWFAYIATLRKMFPEDYNRQGDKKYLNSYKRYFNTEGYKKLVIDDIVMQEIEHVYKEGRNIILKQYPEYYFEDFYKININLKYTYRDVSPKNSDGLIISIKHREKGIFSYLLCFWGKVRNQNYNEKIKGKFNLRQIVLDQKEKIGENTTEYEYMTNVFSDLKTQIISDIENKFTEKIREELTKSVKNKYISLKERIKTNIMSLANLNTKLINEFTFEEISYPKNEYCFLEQNPINYFLYYRDNNIYPSRKMESVEEQYFNKLISDMRINSINWFLDFVYRLRNALFHEIIDPFEEEWQIIFKNAYLILKDLVEINIKYLNEKEKKSEQIGKT